MKRLQIKFEEERRMEDYRVRYQQWLDDPFIDEETKAELRGITDENEIKGAVL